MTGKFADRARILLLCVAATFPLGETSAREEAATDPSQPVWTFYGDAKISKTAAERSPGGAMMRASIDRAGANIWDSAGYASLTRKISKGERVTLGFFARSGTPGASARINAIVGSASPPYPHALFAEVQLDDVERFYCIDAISPVDLARGDGRVTIHLAGGQQIVDLGAFLVTANPDLAESTQLPCEKMLSGN